MKQDTVLHALRALEAITDNGRLWDAHDYHRALRDLGLEMNLQVPSTTEVRDMVLERNGVRANKAGTWKPIKTPRGDCGKAWAFWANWHRSGGNLWGPMMHGTGANRVLYDGMDSLVQIDLKLRGLSSSAIEAWKKTGVV